MKLRYILFFIIFLLSLVCAYQFPVKQYLAEKHLYEFLKQQDGLSPSDIYVREKRKDWNSGRGGYYFIFNVKNSSLEYRYNYSFEETNWLTTYDQNGTSVPLTDQHIIFNEYKKKSYDEEK